MERKLLEVARKTKYPIGAFVFVHNGLDYTVRHIHGTAEQETTDEARRKSRHITGQQLCRGLRDYAIDQYGLMARNVLKHWSIHSCNDFGQIVFTLIEAELMAKNEDDRMEDFNDAFDFSEAFTGSLSIK